MTEYSVQGCGFIYICKQQKHECFFPTVAKTVATELRQPFPNTLGILTTNSLSQSLMSVRGQDTVDQSDTMAAPGEA
ncbi:hypothetical protein KDA_51370 [Dictyobacter alpinus]|uniref:Uncharacterized protein n=1 Tax=Dictyobacter alpinus TaxID=2014873 RepID=A0A402BE35_9CHLR|nr:hypothetical protein KDA_51370 [Dictyobacter alpinus]